MSKSQSNQSVIDTQSLWMNLVHAKKEIHVLCFWKHYQELGVYVLFFHLMEL